MNRVAEEEVEKRTEQTYIKNTGKSAFASASHVAAVDVKDGKIVRIRPFPYDWKYNTEEFRPWKIEARGKTFHAPLKTTISPMGLGYKKGIYSPNRIPYPLKRVDWDPQGAPGFYRPGWAQHSEPRQESLREDLLGRGSGHHGGGAEESHR